MQRHSVTGLKTQSLQVMAFGLEPVWLQSQDPPHSGSSPRTYIHVVILFTFSSYGVCSSPGPLFDIARYHVSLPTSPEHILSLGLESFIDIFIEFLFFRWFSMYQLAKNFSHSKLACKSFPAAPCGWDESASLVNRGKNLSKIELSRTL